MKYCKILLVLFITQYISFQEQTFEGKYLMFYEEGYNSQNCTINLDNGTYKRKLLNGKEISGIIDKQKYRIVLKDKETPYEMIILKSSISNDTIPFGTVDTRDKSKPTGDIVIHQGRLIKIK